MPYRLLVTALGIALASLLPTVNAAIVTCLGGLAGFVSLWAWRSRTPIIITLALFLSGLCWGAGYGLDLLGHLLQSNLEQQPLPVMGEVVDLPESTSRQGLPLVNFYLKVHSACEPACRGFPRLLKLSWQQAPELVPGQRWQLTVQLKRPHGFMNPGGFDYETWLIQRGVGATGYVIADEQNQLLGNNHWHVDHWRWRLATYLDRALRELPAVAIIKGLLLADQRDITTGQWALFQRHGVIHLMVISGLHIGLVSGLVYGCVRWLLLLTGWSHLPDRPAAIAAVLAAAIYSLMAGASLPTQRALVMVCCFMAMIFLRRSSQGGLSLSLAALICLLIDPLAVTSSSFWLSFSAVALLILGFSGRIKARSLWVNGLHSQWLVFVGLVPLLAFAYGEVSVDAPLVNLILVPLYSLLVVPLCFLGLAISWLSEPLALLLWQGSDLLIQYSLRGLMWLEVSDLGGVISLAQVPMGLLLILLVGVVLLLLPGGMPLRYCSPVLILPLFCLPLQRPLPGDMWVAVLDVGQGLSIVVQTAHHTLVYDVGASYPRDEKPPFVVAEATLLPYLRSRGINSLDALVLSHNDNDHAGGWRETIEAVPPRQILAGQVEDDQGAVACSRQQWVWDDVHFRFLSLQAGLPPGRISANNQSCVLLVESEHFSLLIPGDIDADVERLLLAEKTLPERANVLIAPHHGSRSSSSWALLKRLRPEHVVFSAGYRNRFGHPHPDIVARYQRFFSEMHHTSVHGAVEFRVDAGGMLTTTHYRQMRNRYWL